MKRQLENLDTIQVVSVEIDSSLANGAVAWTVTFDTELGDLPMLEVTSGRLTGTHLTLVSGALLRCLPFCLSVGNGIHPLAQAGRSRRKSELLNYKLACLDPCSHP